MFNSNFEIIIYFEFYYYFFSSSILIHLELGIHFTICNIISSGWFNCFIFVFSGLGRSFALTPCPLLLGYYFDKRRSLAFGLASAGFSLGGFVITPAVELMFQTYGFTGTFIILSGVATHITICACIFRPIELHRRLTRKKYKYSFCFLHSRHSDIGIYRAL